MAFTTRKSLLARVREGGEVPWSEFYATYKPLILLCGGDCGLTEDEKDELVQKVMCEIFAKDIIGKYDPDHVPDDVVFRHDPARGRFRHYLRQIIRNQARKIVRGRSRDRLPLDEAAEKQTDDALEAAWDDEWRRHLANMALEELKDRVRPETYVAFEMYALQNRPAQEVAEFLNLSVSSVYTARSRCVAALKEIINSLEEK